MSAIELLKEGFFIETIDSDRGKKYNILTIDQIGEKYLEDHPERKRFGLRQVLGDYFSRYLKKNNIVYAEFLKEIHHKFLNMIVLNDEIFGTNFLDCLGDFFTDVVNQLNGNYSQRAIIFRAKPAFETLAFCLIWGQYNIFSEFVWIGENNEVLDLLDPTQQILMKNAGVIEDIFAKMPDFEKYLVYQDLSLQTSDSGKTKIRYLSVFSTFIDSCLRNLHTFH